MHKPNRPFGSVGWATGVVINLNCCFHFVHRCWLLLWPLVTRAPKPPLGTTLKHAGRAFGGRGWVIPLSHMRWTFAILYHTPTKCKHHGTCLLNRQAQPAVGSENAWRRHLTESEGGANTEVRLVRWKANIGLGDEQAALERLAGDHAGEDWGWPLCERAPFW